MKSKKSNRRNASPIEFPEVPAASLEDSIPQNSERRTAGKPAQVRKKINSIRDDRTVLGRSKPSNVVTD